MPVRVRVTEEEYLATMTGVNPALEFVNGEVFQKPMPKSDHFLIVDEILARLREYRRSAGGRSGPEATVNLGSGSDRRYRVPDAAYWAPGKPFGHGIVEPPTLAVEVLSDGQSGDDLRAKCREYRARGVDVCWLIDPMARAVEIFEGGREGLRLSSTDAITSAHLPGLEIAVQDIWGVLDS